MTLNKSCVIGLDFGSLSARGILVDFLGHNIGHCVYAYPHQVIDQNLPDGTPLAPDWALQHPQDYLDALNHIIPRLAKRARQLQLRVCGIGIVCTASTVIAVDEEFSPLCAMPRWAGTPHAWPKMWKHHAAQTQSERLLKEANKFGKKFIGYYAGQLLTECTFPKILEIIEEEEEVFKSSWRILEVGDWLVSLLVGHEVRSTSTASCKAMWSREKGYPDFSRVHPLLGLPIREKLGLYTAKMLAPGEKAGLIKPEYAHHWGIPEDTALSASQMDGHAAVKALGIGEKETLLVIGTSTALLYQSKRRVPVPGYCSVEYDCDVPHLCGYAAGQAGVGDCFLWFEKNLLPDTYKKEAQERGISNQSYLTELAASLSPGESGLLSLDWWNGNKSVLSDTNLSGLILGLNIQTKPEEIYRALIEGTAFGLWKIMSALNEQGEFPLSFRACGGVAEQNKLLMSIYSNVLEVPIKLTRCKQPSALGSAINAAAACGIYGDIFEASAHMAEKDFIMIYPHEEDMASYRAIKQDYDELYHYFGLSSGIMHRLKQNRKECFQKKFSKERSIT